MYINIPSETPINSKGFNAASQSLYILKKEFENRDLPLLTRARPHPLYSNVFSSNLEKTHFYGLTSLLVPFFGLRDTIIINDLWK